MANLDLCMDEHPHRGQLIVEYDWSEVGAQHPDSMVVVALRPVFRDKVSGNWASDMASGEDRLYGRFISCATGGSEVYRSPLGDGSARDSLFLPAGEWIISSYTSSQSTIELARDYTADVSDDGGKLFYGLDVLDRLPEERSYWYDRNPHGSWVDASESASACMAGGSVVIDEFAYKKKDYKVTLRPRPVAQKVSIAFEAEIQDADITVDSIVCAISGIAGKMNLNTMELGMDATHQAIFGTELSATSQGHVRARGTVFVPGLACSSSAAMLHEPGMLDACVFVHYTDEQGIRRERRLDASVNLFRILSVTPSVKYDEDGKALQACRTLNLNIDGTMLISGNKISSADDAPDKWVDETIINR